MTSESSITQRSRRPPSGSAESLRPRPNGPGWRRRTPTSVRSLEPDGTWRGWSCSALLHALVVLATILGLPSLFHHQPLEDQPIAVQLINVSEFTRATAKNPRPVKDAKAETPPPDPAPTVEPPKPDPEPPPPAPPPPESSAPPPAPAPEVKPVAEPVPQPAPEPVPVPAAKPKPEPKPEPVPKPEEKPEPPKQVAKADSPKPPDKAKPKPEQDFDQLLKNLAKQDRMSDKTSTQKPTRQVASQAASAQPNAPLGDRLSTSELDVLRQQIEDCWSVPAGAKDATDLKVEVHIDVAEDGTITDARIVDDGRYESDPFYRAAADSARRAALNPKCSRLKVPPEKYDQWKSINLFFDPKDQLS